MNKFLNSIANGGLDSVLIEILSYEYESRNLICYELLKEILKQGAKSVGKRDALKICEFVFLNCDLITKSMAIDLLSYCSEVDAIKFIEEFAKNYNDENICVGFLYYLSTSPHASCKLIVSFLDERNTSLVREIAARVVLISGQSPVLDSVMAALDVENDPYVAANLAAIQYLLLKKCGVLDSRCFSILKDGRISGDQRLREICAYCFDFIEDPSYILHECSCCFLKNSRGTIPNCGDS